MPRKSTLAVVIPSRSQSNQLRFLSRAIASVETQSVAKDFDIRVIVAIDRGQWVNEIKALSVSVKQIESCGSGQAAALNAGLRDVHEEYLAFLEDDDEWQPTFLANAMLALQHGDFVSSTQFEVDENGKLLRINDFATPSGWLMPARVFREIGFFNEGYRFHIDNEWLGRLNESETARVHLVEATAPSDSRYAAQVRPWLAQILRSSQGRCRLARHGSPFPLVKRLVHSHSGMFSIGHDPESQAISRAEQLRLVERFACVPW